MGALCVSPKRKKSGCRVAFGVSVIIGNDATGRRTGAAQREEGDDEKEVGGGRGREGDSVDLTWAADKERRNE